MIIYLFLDYDGTMVPITRNPREARLSPAARRLLKKISLSPAFRLYIISGRMLKDIKSKIRLPNAVYVGNHGLEIEGKGITFRGIVTPRFKAVLETIRQKLARRLSVVRGVIVEDKGVMISLHYRMVDEKQIPLMKKLLKEIILPYYREKKIKVRQGKKVFEIWPPVDWDKGKAITWLLSKQKVKNILPVYLGDDTPDEPAFKVLRKTGITIRVGEK
jgi:trehalose-phosphatase